VNKVTIVVPVYADWPSLKDCLKSLIEHVDKKHSILIVNDSGPEADELEKSIKELISGQNNFIYERNSKNLGFVGTTNRAVKILDKTNNDILLLNSDTKVTKGFLEELTAVLNDNVKNAVVSPRSNNATLCTLPISAAQKKGIKPERSYKLFLKIKNKLPRYNEAPTAHGFCILIKRSVIKKYGLFDKVFGRGYGEEVDFCQRIQKDGFKCLISNRSYVFHLEARSFTLEKKTELLKTNNKIIRERYPDYKKEVTKYFDEQIHAERKKIGIFWRILIKS